MELSYKQFKKQIKHRLPDLSMKEIDFYYISIIKILIRRVINNETITIDNFGILARKKQNPKEITNVHTKERQEIVSNIVVFHPDPSFLEFFKDKKNVEKLKKIILKKSEVFMEKIKKRARNKLR